MDPTLRAVDGDPGWVLALTLLLRRDPLAPLDGTQWVVFLGGVKGTFSVVLEDEA